MFTQKRIISLAMLFIVVSFVLVGCERPFSSTEEGEAVATDPNAGGGQSQPVDSSATEAETETAVIPTAAPSVEEAEAETESEMETETAVEPESTETEEMETSEEAASTAEETESNEETAPPKEESSTTTTDTTTTAETSSTTTTSPSSATCPVTHTVQAGENLYRIGLQYDMSWVPIANANGLPNANAIYVGQVLIIPVASCAPVPPQPEQPIEGTTYVVQPGDNLYQIGLMFGISWVQIAEANGIVNPNQIYVGQVLKIPVAQSGPTPDFTHLVQPGETLYTISIQYGVPWQAVAAANNIPPPYIVYAGQTIIIPGSW